MKPENEGIEEVPVQEAEAPADSDGALDLRRQRQIKSWLVDYLANLLELPKDQINTKVEFERMGLDSSSAVAMTGDLEVGLGIRIDTTAAYDFSTVEKLAAHLAKLPVTQGPRTGT